MKQSKNDKTSSGMLTLNILLVPRSKFKIGRFLKINNLSYFFVLIPSSSVVKRNASARRRKGDGFRRQTLCQIHDITSMSSREYAVAPTGTTHYHAQLGLPDRGRKIKGLVVCYVV